MVTSTELAVIGTLAGAAVSGGLSLLGVKLRQGAESERRYGEVFLQKRAERLVDLHDALARCENTIDRFKHSHQDSSFEFIEAERPKVEEEIVDSFLQGDRADIFLEEEQIETLNNGLNGLISLYVFYSEEHAEDDLEGFDTEEDARKSIEAAKRVLKQEINDPTYFDET